MKHINVRVVGYIDISNRTCAYALRARQASPLWPIVEVGHRQGRIGHG